MTGAVSPFYCYFVYHSLASLLLGRVSLLVSLMLHCSQMPIALPPAAKSPCTQVPIALPLMVKPFRSPALGSFDLTRALQARHICSRFVI